MDRLIKIGKIVSPHGIKGQIKVYNYSRRDRFEDISEITIDKETFNIESITSVKHMVILKVHGIDDRNSAEALRGKDIFMDEKYLDELKEDEYLIRDLIGLDVFRDESSSIGKVIDVLQYGPSDTYEIKMNNGKMAYIPAVKEFIKDVDLEKGITIETIPGLIDDEF
ncbi:MAG: ribosome maturation factor RimM [Clostridiales bacterium]|nr:ribosome maturation factor RimM [Clostridiales bacterium]MDY6116406.1 ribosome maturation factor RimM [Anaerovoracaceae bacterium]